MNTSLWKYIKYLKTSNSWLNAPPAKALHSDGNVSAPVVLEAQQVSVRVGVWSGERLGCRRTEHLQACAHWQIGSASSTGE